MDTITQLLMQRLSGEGLSQISRHIGANEKTTSSALSSAVPLLVSALANNASKSGGAQSLHQALSKDHDGSIFDNMSSFLENPAASKGEGILGHILGSRQPTVMQGLTQGTGLNIGQVGQLLKIAAPLVMGLLGKQKQEEELDSDSLSGFLGKQKQQAHESNPGLMGALNNLLDKDNDGSVLDDMVGMAGKLF